MPPEMNPDLNGPIVAFLASEQAGHVNGQIFGRRGYAFTLFQTPEAARGDVQGGRLDGGRDREELRRRLRRAPERPRHPDDGGDEAGGGQGRGRQGGGRARAEASVDGARAASRTSGSRRSTSTARAPSTRASSASRSVRCDIMRGRRRAASIRHIFFDTGDGQLIAFMEPRGIPGIPVEYDAGINRGLGVPDAFYHFAFEVELASRRSRRSAPS